MAEITKLPVQKDQPSAAYDGSSKGRKTLLDLVGAEADRIEAQYSALRDRANDLREIDFDDHFLRFLEQCKRTKWTADALFDAWQSFTQPKRERAQRENEVWERIYQKSDQLKYLELTNARGNRVHLLAEDATCARYLAWQNDRISDKSNGRVRVIEGDELDRHRVSKAIKSAIADGRAGEIEFMGEHVINKRSKTVF